MEILIRTMADGKGRWVKVKEHEYQNESALQNILYKSPDIIPIEKLGVGLLEPKLFIKEAGLPGSGFSDLIGIDELGSITIIECKLAANPEIKRKVIGQVFEYAAYLWQMEYDQFDAVCSQAEKWNGRRLVDVMKGVLGVNASSWSESDFRSNLALNLKQGIFHLIIAVDAINDDLKRTLQFLNSRGDNSAKIYALEMRQFESPELNMQMLVPELFGYTPSKQTNSGKQWTESEFFTAIASRQPKEVVSVARKILDWANEKNLKIYWGSGKVDGSFIPAIKNQNEEYYPIAVSTDGSIGVQFYVLKTRVAFADEAKRTELSKRFSQVQGVTLSSHSIEGSPSIKMIGLKEQTSLNEFIDVLDWIVQVIKEQPRS